ncbi:RNA-guided endonuclease InsQ/TnpB family protein [Ectothiorhodospira variabilis]|uniref:RNA-guided endonuclease InsQ/TnpB family protein n=2 Tax=Ectothiorhodospira variabilis TaxID=505694 RepID=UPI001EFA5568|nr:transposase [Ectothiorhodospira variabilis]MCG5495026.1 transposase [Ectothiorhodospira variabilis]MCG5504613.1 transposase [Ectothiorhodospira variabilis]MCG5507834.1 transposase [Ectothiorhodospira variabilis]
MIRAHRIALAPNNRQATYFARAAGTARFAYNWALAEWQCQYAAWKQDNSLPKPSQAGLRRQLNAVKREQFPWMLEVTKTAPQMAIIQLGEAFRNFFAGRARYPKFRKKGVHDRFTLTNDQFRVEGSRIRIPNLGWVRMRESLRFAGKIMSATVSRVADRWFVSITVETEDPPRRPAENQGSVGVDLGVSALATLSTGDTITGPKAHTALLKRLRRVSRSLSRKQKGSSNRNKAKAKLARLHARIANIRQDALHKLTSDLTRRFHTIGIEDLNVRGMMANRHLARSIADMSFHECRRQLAYKADQRGGQVVVADRWFPSSKMCSVCGAVQKAMPLSTRQWICPDCGVHHDRDVNAARNLAHYAVSSTVSACGEEGAGSGRETGVKPASVKQEISTEPV